jgi:hypothetical protein
MFDPTAFDNMKVVLEGALYDLDLTGEILIIDRNDLVNIAKLSRKFEVTFRLSDETRVKAAFGLEAKLENLAAELLSPEVSKLAGCNLLLSFTMEHRNEPIIFEKLDRLLHEIWGSDRLISQNVQYNPLANNKKITNLVKIDFARLIYEEQMADLDEMIEFMVITLNKIQSLL